MGSNVTSQLKTGAVAVCTSSQKYDFLRGCFKPFKDVFIANRAEQVELMKACCLSEELKET